MYLDSIIKLVGNKNYKNSEVIFCMDSPKEDLWRTELKPDYKGDRCDLTKKSNFNHKSFKSRIFWITYKHFY